MRQAKNDFLKDVESILVLFVVFFPANTQRHINVFTTSLQRRCNVMTLQRRCNDVVTTLCVCSVVFWLQIAIEPFALFHHSIFYFDFVFTVVFY